MQIHYNGTLFGQGTEIEAMQRGNLEVGMVSPQDIAALIPEYSIFTTGYLMRDPAHLDAVYDGDIGAEYKAQVEKDVGITHREEPVSRHAPRHPARSRRRSKTPADLAGLKLRMPGSEAWQFLGNSLGANATPLAFEEVYLAMQTGTIDGLENPLPDAMAAKFYEVSKQIVLTGHMVANTFFAVAKRVLGRPDATSRRRPSTAAEAAAKTFNDDGVVATEKDAVAFMEGKGLKVTTPDVAAFRDQVLDKFVEFRLRQELAGRHARPHQGGRRLSHAASLALRDITVMTNLGAKLKRGAELVAAASFALMFGAFMIQIVSRYIFNAPVSWSLEICSIGYIWVVFLTCDILVLTERQHIVFDVLYQKFPPRQRRALGDAADTPTLGLIFLAALPVRPRLPVLPRPAQDHDPARADGHRLFLLRHLHDRRDRRRRGAALKRLFGADWQRHL